MYKYLLKNIFLKLFILLFGSVFYSYSENVELFIKGNNTPGPYNLGKSFIDTSSISVDWKDSSSKEVPPFIYIGQKNGLLFSQSIDSTSVIKVNFETRFRGVSKNYSLFKKRFLTEEEINDTSVLIKKILTQKGLNELTVSGYKSIGVTAGNNGRFDLNQALEVKIFGKLSEKTVLSANLSDQGTSLDGDTREIGEIDLLYVKLENPLFNIIIGDMYKKSISDGILVQDKKIKGFSASYTGEKFGISAYGAMSGGKFAIDIFQGTLGIQGPFYLDGNGEDDIINPVGGTVKVLLNGKEMKEGEENDFVVDYDLGTINFTEKRPLDNNSNIRVEYEYKSFDYQRLFSGAELYANLWNSKLKMRGFFWHETDNKEYPLDIELDKEIIDSLKTVGDRLPLVPTGRKVNKNDVPSMNAKYRLYKMQYVNSNTREYRYVYYEYNPSKPEDNEGYYWVSFHETGINMGEYIIDSNYVEDDDIRGNVYTYVGAGNGNYTALAEVSAPKRTLSGEFIVNFSPTEHIELNVDIAGEGLDKNTFSSIDDKDNYSSAIDNTLSIGKKDYYERSAWFKVDQKYSSSRFSRSVLSGYTIKNRWDINVVDTTSNNLWEATSGVTIWNGIALYGGYGQLIQEDKISSQRGSYGLFLGRKNLVEALYSGNILNHRIDTKNLNVFKDSINLSLFLKPIDLKLFADDEWRENIEGENTGKIGSGLSIGLNKIDLNESFYYSQARKGGNSIFNPFHKSSRDTGYTLIWEQGLKREIRSGWNVSINSHYQKEQTTNDLGDNSEVSALLINAENRLNSQKHDASSSQTYTLSSERASFLEFVPGPYLGVGNGNYKKDSIDNEWIFDDKYGTHDGTFIELYDSSRVRKSTLKGSWHFNPDKKRVKGLGGDLKWRGSFSINEHIADDVLSYFYSWIPGITTLTGKMDRAVTYANMFYKQDIVWAPTFIKSFSTTFTLRPYIENDRISKDAGFEGLVRNYKRWSKFTLENDLQGNLLNRGMHSSKDEINIRDIGLSLLQRYYFVPVFSIFSKENIGVAERSSELEIDSLASGPYFSIQPGFTLRLPKKGWAELSYTYSLVDISDNIEYPMAQGFYNGETHSIQFFIDIRAGDHININGSYRGDFGDNTPDEKWLHLLSLEMKIML